MTLTIDTSTRKILKRIHKVTIKRMVDESPDTSWLGEYSNSPDSEYSIDRAHSLDCASIPANHSAAVDQLERVIAYLETVRQLGEPPTNIYWAAADESQDVLIELQDSLEECDCCTNGRWDNREYRYFNPNVANYKGEPDADIRRYCEQDYARMESLNSGDWCFIGIRVDAEYSVGNARAGYLAQKLTSGGLWGIESDSSEDYLTSVESEELDALAAQLKGIGFSSRAIAAAFKNIERETN